MSKGDFTSTVKMLHFLLQMDLIHLIFVSLVWKPLCNFAFFFFFFFILTSRKNRGFFAQSWSKCAFFCIFFWPEVDQNVLFVFVVFLKIFCFFIEANLRTRTEQESTGIQDSKLLGLYFMSVSFLPQVRIGGDVYGGSDGEPNTECWPTEGAECRAGARIHQEWWNVLRSVNWAQRQCSGDQVGFKLFEANFDDSRHRMQKRSLWSLLSEVWNQPWKQKKNTHKTKTKKKHFLEQQMKAEEAWEKSAYWVWRFIPFFFVGSSEEPCNVDRIALGLCSNSSQLWPEESYCRCPCSWQSGARSVSFDVVWWNLQCWCILFPF